VREKEREREREKKEKFWKKRCLRCKLGRYTFAKLRTMANSSREPDLNTYIHQTPAKTSGLKGRLHTRIRVRIGVRFGVPFVAKGGLQSNLGLIFS
jgi:hypothetical protein